MHVRGQTTRPSEDMIHPLFKEQDGDLIVQSSDEILFILRQRQITDYAGDFPVQASRYVNGLPAVVLPEPARVLEIVLHFFYPDRRYPVLEDAAFKLVMSVAQAVEKYQVFAARTICVKRLRYFVREYPALITSYATKYNHPSLINEAAPHLLFSPLYETAEQLPSSDVLSWLRYVKATRDAMFTPAKRFIKNCQHSAFCDSSVTAPLTNGIIRADCQNALLAWIAHLEEILSRSAYEEELESHRNLFGMDCIGIGGTCFWLNAVVHLCREGLKRASMIQYSTFLRRSR